MMTETQAHTHLIGEKLREAKLSHGTGELKGKGYRFSCSYSDDSHDALDGIITAVEASEKSGPLLHVNSRFFRGEELIGFRYDLAHGKWKAEVRVESGRFSYYGTLTLHE